MKRNVLSALAGLLICFIVSGCVGKSDSKEISYTTNAENLEVYLLNRTTQKVYNLTNNSYDDWWSSWSPDGKRMAFASIRHGNYDIYIMDVDKEEVRQIINNPADDGWPAWSPNGKYIVYSTNQDDNYELYRVDIDGETPDRKSVV